MLPVTLFIFTFLPLLAYSFATNLNPREGKQVFDRDSLICAFLCPVIDDVLATAVAGDILACTCVQNLGLTTTSTLTITESPNTETTTVILPGVQTTVTATAINTVTQPGVNPPGARTTVIIKSTATDTVTLPGGKTTITTSPREPGYGGAPSVTTSTKTVTSVATSTRIISSGGDGSFPSARCPDAQNVASTTMNFDDIEHSGTCISLPTPYSGYIFSQNAFEICKYQPCYTGDHVLFSGPGHLHSAEVDDPPFMSPSNTDEVFDLNSLGVLVDGESKANARIVVLVECLREATSDEYKSDIKIYELEPKVWKEASLLFVGCRYLFLSARYQYGDGTISEDLPLAVDQVVVTKYECGGY